MSIYHHSVVDIQSFNKIRVIVANLSNGQIKVFSSAITAPNDDVVYPLSFERVDGKRLTKVQIAWIDATVEAINATIRSY